MTEAPFSAADFAERQNIGVLDSSIATVDRGRGAPTVFLHGNPTSSYLWRNVVPHVERFGRCLAPDLIGMGKSGKAPAGSYRFNDHARYLDAWFEALALQDVILVVHDWGSALGFHWARRHPERVAGIVYMEAVVRPLSWSEWPDSAKKVFQAMRSSAGEEMVLQKNVFIERILPASVLHGLSEETMAAYRAPFVEPGESRRPMLTWPREIPLNGEPADVHAVVQDYANWLASSSTPKLFIDGDPGFILAGAARDFCRAWPNQREVRAKGLHFLQEDSPQEIGEAIARFVEDVRGGRFQT